MLNRIKERDERTVRRATDMEFLQTELICELVEQLHRALGAVDSAGIGAGESVRRVVEADHAKLARQLRHPVVPHVQAAEMAVEQHQGRTPALVSDVKRHAVDRDELRRRLRIARLELRIGLERRRRARCASGTLRRDRQSHRDRGRGSPHAPVHQTRMHLRTGNSHAGRTAWDRPDRSYRPAPAAPPELR